jgi:dimethylglycine catabolism A
MADSRVGGPPASLTDPIKIGPIQVKNRIVLPPHGTNYAEVAGGERLAEYYRLRAQGGVGLIIHEAVPVHPSGARLSGKVYGWREESVAGFALVANAVRAADTRVFVQLYHAGRQMTPGKGMRASWGPSASPCPETRSPVHPMSHDDIQDVIEGFATSARNVSRGGLDGVEIHAAHGYLLTAFMSRISNFRTDEYGGSFDRRMRFALEVLEAVQKAISDDIAMGIRISADELVAGGLHIDDTCEILDYLRARVRMDYVSVSLGNYTSHENVVPDHSFPPTFNADRAGQIRAAILPVPVLLSGRVRNAEDCQRILSEGKADMVGAVRAQIADPTWARAMLSPQTSTSPRPCIYCNEDCRTNLGRGLPIACAINPEVGVAKSTVPLNNPIRTRKGMVVIGAGPAGITAALQARRVGLHAVLYEARSQIGGQLRVAVEDTGRTELASYLQFLENELLASGVELRLGEYLDPVAGLPFDDVIVAVGAKQHRPDWATKAASDGVSVRGSWDALRSRELSGGRVVVVDNGEDSWQMASTAEELARRGCRVTIVTEGAYAGYRLPPLSVRPFVSRLERVGIVTHPFRTVHQATVSELLLGSVVTERDAETIAFDAIVYSGGHEPDLDEVAKWTELPDSRLRVQIVGDAYATRGLGTANREGLSAIEAICAGAIEPHLRGPVQRASTPSSREMPENIDEDGN